jgi:hypothetical protein
VIEQLAEVAFYRAVAFVSLVLAGIIGLAIFYGERILPWFILPWSLLIPTDMTGRDWATVVMAVSAAGVAFVVLSAPGLVLFLLDVAK